MCFECTNPMESQVYCNKCERFFHDLRQYNVNSHWNITDTKSCYQKHICTSHFAQYFERENEELERDFGGFQDENFKDNMFGDQKSESIGESVELN